jgi:hypothetical protein
VAESRIKSPSERRDSRHHIGHSFVELEQILKTFYKPPKVRGAFGTLPRQPSDRPLELVSATNCPVFARSRPAA